MGIEREYKFACTARQNQILKPFLVAQSGGEPEIKHQYNTYFDTPDFALKEHGITLRQRSVNNMYFEQTIKLKGKAAANGLFDRQEFNIDLEEERMNVALFETHPDYKDIKEVVATILAYDIEPLFATEYTRLAYKMDWQNSILEYAYDNGEIFAYDHHGSFSSPVRKKGSEPISEIELELVEGNTEALDHFKEFLMDVVYTPLKPISLSKGERGYTLYQRLHT